MGRFWVVGGQMTRWTDIMQSVTRRVVVGLVDNEAFNGAFGHNPFNFKHFSLMEIGLYLDVQQHGIKPLALNFGAHQFIHAYLGLFTGTGKENRDEGNGIARSDFENGYALYAFDLSRILEKTITLI